MPESLIDWRGNDLTLVVGGSGGGLVSMRRNQGSVSLYVGDNYGFAVNLVPAQVAELVASLVAALAIEASRSAVGGEPEATS